MTYIPAAFRSYRLGSDVSSADSLDGALGLAGMNWGLKVVEANDVAVRETREDGSVSGWVHTRAPEQRFVMRTDNWDTLGVVRGSYQDVDNRTAFGVAEAMVSQIPDARYSRAFELDFGRQAYLELRMPESDIRVGDGNMDVIRAGMRFQTTHDGQGSIRGSVTLERQVCTNGMVVQIKDVGHSYKIRHSLSASDRLLEAQKIAISAGQYIETFAQTARFMIATPMSPLEFGAFLDDLIPQPVTHGGPLTWTAKEKRDMNAWGKRRQELVKLFRTADTNESGRGTRWAAFNAITEQADWSGTVRQGNAGNLEQARAVRQLEGKEQNLKDAAFTRLAVGLAA